MAQQCRLWRNSAAPQAILASFRLESRAGFHTCLQRGGYGKPPYGVSRQELANAQQQRRDKKHHLPNHCPGLTPETLGPRQSLIVAKTGQRVAMQRARSAENLTHDSD